MKLAANSSSNPTVMPSVIPEASPRRSPPGVVAVERGLSILDAFLAAEASQGLSELARSTGLPKPTVLRSLTSLERMGYVVRLSSGRYQLGAKLVQLGDAYRARFRLEDHVLPVLRHVASVTGESAAFNVPEKDGRVALFRVQSQQSVRDVQDYPAFLPADATAVSRVLTSADWAEDIARGHPRVYMTSGVYDPQTASMATAVFGPGGRLVGGLTISGPTDRLVNADVAVTARQLAEAAHGLSAALGAPRRPACLAPELIRA